MELTLVAPGLLDIAVSPPVDADASAPALARLLAAALPSAIERDGAAAIACAALGIARQADWPVAPWLARAAGLDRGVRYCLCAEPATFVIGRADVRLSGLVRDLAESETNALLATLNAHFASDGIDFVALEPSRWLVRTAAAQALTTHPPDAALDAPLLALLPTGADAPRWRRWQSEMQMLLFEHPVNRERESAGLPVVNGVWLWGGGAPAATESGKHIAVLFADTWLPRVLARAAGVASAPVPRSLAALRGDAFGSPLLVWLNEPGEGRQRIVDWLAAIDRDWAEPVARAFDAGQIHRLEIVLTGRAGALRFPARRLTLTQRWRNWRSAPRLSALIGAAAR